MHCTESAWGRAALIRAALWLWPGVRRAGRSTAEPAAGTALTCKQRPCEYAYLTNQVISLDGGIHPR